MVLSNQGTLAWRRCLLCSSDCDEVGAYSRRSTSRTCHNHRANSQSLRLLENRTVCTSWDRPFDFQGATAHPITAFEAGKSLRLTPNYTKRTFQKAVNRPLSENNLKRLKEK
jgi:hypothetical protein